MKILLLGEFSGFFKNLKEGFLELGHNVTLVAESDNWKKIPGADISLDSTSKYKFLTKINREFQYMRNLPKLHGYDIVLIINPRFFKKLFGLYFINYIVKNNNKIFLSACGDDVEYIRYGLANNYKYWPHMDCDIKNTNYYNSFYDKLIHKVLLNKVKKVIPTSYEYKLSWDNSVYKEKVSDVILLPITINRKIELNLKKNHKIIFFHGLNRECFKGTKYIREALNIIKNKYPNEVECIIRGNMELNEYLTLLSKTDIVLDQCKVYSHGSMNALYSMSLGKIIMGGMCKEVKKYIHGNTNIIFHIEPNVEQIVKQLEYIISNKKSIDKWKMETQKFLQENHDSIMIAKKYIDIFNKS